MRHMHVYVLLMLVFFTPCTGQNKAQPKTNSRSAGTTHVKVKKTKPTVNRLAENVHCGIQDQDGNLWFGTRDVGLFRFDGKSFVNFSE